MATDICDYLIIEESRLPTSWWRDAIREIDGAIGSLFVGRNVPKVPETPLLNLGSGTLNYPGWINADCCSLTRRFRQRGFRPDWQMDATKTWKAPDNYFDGIFTQHVIEHFSYMRGIFVLDECFRTLKPGAWLRVSVPDIDKFINFAALNDSYPRSFRCRPWAISNITQHWGHKSVWDVSLMMEVLTERRFIDVRGTEFGVGTDTRLAKMDGEERRGESLYVEAKKPLQ